MMKTLKLFKLTSTYIIDLFNECFYPEAAAQARAEPEPALPRAFGLGLKFYRPRLSKAEPKPGLSGRAGPAHH